MTAVTDSPQSTLWYPVGRRGIALSVVLCILFLLASPANAQDSSQQLTPDQMIEIFDTTALVDVAPRANYPSITGNVAADEHIYQLAEARGFRLRGSYVGPTTQVDGVPLHPLAAAGYTALVADARADGVSLSAIFGLRDLALQRTLFMRRILAVTTVAKIAAGTADSAVTAAMCCVAPPGFSKHHTGHAVDFRTSDNYSWLTRNNYANALANGWLPSYPTGATVKYGPNPEILEFVYVGLDAIHCGDDCPPVRSYARANLEELEAGPNQIRIHGWAYDPDFEAFTTVVHVYAFYDGSQVPVALDTPVVRAGGFRPDVNRAFAIEGNHGFNRALSIRSGNHRVCAYSLSVDPDGNLDDLNRLIDCRNVTITDQAPARGVYDFLAANGDTLTVYGWAYDLDAETQALSVEIHVDGVLADTINADMARLDVNKILGVSGPHGFDHKLVVSAGTHEVCIFAVGIDRVGQSDGSKVALGCRTATTPS